MNNSILISIVICLVISIGSGLGFFLYVYQPEFEKGKELEHTVDDRKQKLESFNKIDNEIKEYNAKIKEKEAEKKKLKTENIKLEEVVPKLLDSTETVSNKFDVKFQDIRISPLVRAEDWSELPVEMTVLGTFDNISSFLVVMEQRKLINLAAGSMNVSVSSEVDKVTLSPMLSVNLSAKVYIISLD